MLTKSKIVISFAIVLVSASTVAAKDGGLPKLNTEFWLPRFRKGAGDCDWHRR